MTATTATYTAARSTRRDEPPTAAALAIALREVRKVHGDGEGAVVALDAVSVGLAKGSFTAIMGPSGSGKSTLLHVAAGLDRPTSGTVMFGNTDLSRLSERRLTILRREQIGFVFQAFTLPRLRSLRTSRCRCAWTVSVRGGRTCGKLRHASVLRNGWATVHPSCQVVSNSGSRLPGHW